MLRRKEEAGHVRTEVQPVPRVAEVRVLVHDETAREDLEHHLREPQTRRSHREHKQCDNRRSAADSGRTRNSAHASAAKTEVKVFSDALSTALVVIQAEQSQL